MQSNHLKNVFQNSNIILAQKPPKNLLCLLFKTRFNIDTNNFMQRGYKKLHGPFFINGVQLLQG